MSVFQIAVRGQHSLHYKTVWIHVRRHSDISVSSEDSIDLHVFECCSDPCTEASWCRSGPLQRAEQMKMCSYTSPSQIRRFVSIFGGNGLIVMLMLFFWGAAHSSLFFYFMVLLNDAEHPSFSQNKRAIRWKQRIFLSSLWMWEWQPVQAGPATELRQAPASHCSSMQLKQMQFFYLSVLCGNNWAISNLLVQWVSRPADRLFVLYFMLNSFDCHVYALFQPCICTFFCFMQV